MSSQRKFEWVQGVLQRRKVMVPITMLRTAEPGRASSVPLNGLNPVSIHGCSRINVMEKLTERAGSEGDKGTLVSWNVELAEKMTGRAEVPWPWAQKAAPTVTIAAVTTIESTIDIVRTRAFTTP